MTDQPINLTHLRDQAQQDLEYQQIGGLDTSYPLGVLALIDVAEAARELADAADYLAIYPEGAVGVDELVSATEALRETLARFQ